MLGLAPSHPLLQVADSSAMKVSFPSQMAAQRKRKRGKHSGTLRAWDTICTLEIGDAVYNIPACIGGQVLEVNLRLETQPSLLLTRVSLNSDCAENDVTRYTNSQPADEGFIAMVAPSFDITLDSVDVAGAAGIAAATGGDGGTVPAGPGRKQQLPLVGMCEYEELANQNMLPPFQKIEVG